MRHRTASLLVVGSSLLAALTPAIAGNLRDNNVLGLFGDESSQVKGHGVNTILRQLQSENDDISLCSNGIPGVESESGQVCCAVGCSGCGGIGCSGFGLPEFDAFDCCVTEIVDFGMSCAEKGSSPCFINEQIGRCPNGVDGMASDDATVCCDPSCDTCSEDACADSGCCPTEIIAAAQLCTFVGVAPCVIDEDVMMCDNGVNGIDSSNGEVCCVAACGRCGGAGCSTIARPTFDAFDCCVSEILDFGKPCSETGTAPCFVDGETEINLPAPAPTGISAPTPVSAPIGVPSPTPAPSPIEIDSLCGNGVPGIESSDGRACCAAGCGECGGVGCSTRGLPDFDADDCCVTEIVDFGSSCSAKSSAPCAIVDGEPGMTLPAPAPTGVSPPTPVPAPTGVSPPTPVPASTGVSPPTPVPAPTVVSSPTPDSAPTVVSSPTPVSAPTVVSPPTPVSAPTVVSPPTAVPAPTGGSPPTAISAPTVVSSPTAVPAPTAVSPSTPVPAPTVVSPPTPVPAPTVGSPPTPVPVPTVVSSPTPVPAPTVVSPPTPVPASTVVSSPTPVPAPTGVPPLTPVPTPTVVSSPTPVPAPTVDSLPTRVPAPTVVSSPTPATAPIGNDSFCSSGVRGIESSDGRACCVAECGECGGMDCSTRGLPDFDADDCCVTEIVNFGSSCSATNSAPCAIVDGGGTTPTSTPTSTPVDIFTMMPVGGGTTPTSTPTSTPVDIFTMMPVGGTTTPNNMPTAAPVAPETSSPTSTPGTIASICSNGYRGIQSSNGLVCCALECGQCGGVGCSTVGMPDLGADDCCETEIMEAGVSCEETSSAPCIIEGDTAPPSTPTSTPVDIFTMMPVENNMTPDNMPTAAPVEIITPTPTAPETSSPTSTPGAIASICSNGYTGIQSSNGLVCCTLECGQCGGVGCSTVGMPDLGADDCCETEIMEMGVSCEETSSAPCIIEEGDTAPPSTSTSTPVGISTPMPVGDTASTSTPTSTPVDIFTMMPVEGDTMPDNMPTAAPVDIITTIPTAPETSSPTSTPGAIASICSNGYTGIQSSNGLVCCTMECGQCGGVGCSTVGMPDLGADDCCETEIMETGVSCEETSSAPCIIEEGDTAPPSTPTPTPAGISTPTPVEGDTTPNNMPTAAPVDIITPMPVAPGTSPPTTTSDDVIVSVCSNGFPGYGSLDGQACCVTGCGQCGGEDCATVGLPDLGPEDCCATEIMESGSSCEEMGEAPCYLGEIIISTEIPTPAPVDLVTGTPAPNTTPIVGIGFTCSNGYPGVESSNGLACCVAACGQCGGVGCSTVGLPDYDADDCCSTEIVEMGVSCAETDSAPCFLRQAIIAADTPTTTPIPTTAPVFVFTPYPIQILTSDTFPCTATLTNEGCYMEGTEDPFFSKSEDANLTPESCLAICSDENALYMGLIGGNECACGNDESFLSSDKTEGSCTSACQGDDEQFCGGSLAFSLYSIGNTCT